MALVEKMLEKFRVLVEKSLVKIPHFRIRVLGPTRKSP
jgi:hypothetical protein